jgi:hypothetical protein
VTPGGAGGAASALRAIRQYSGYMNKGTEPFFAVLLLTPTPENCTAAVSTNVISDNTNILGRTKSIFLAYLRKISSIDRYQ